MRLAALAFVLPACSYEPARDDCEGCGLRPITFSSMIAGGPHLDFPALIVLPPDLGTVAFVDADDQPLAFERRGDVAWVRVPSLAAGTIIYLHADAIDRQDPAATWNEFQGVWHLDDLRDVSTHANHGIGAGGIQTSVPGRVGAAVHLDRIDGHIEVTDSPSLDSVVDHATFSMWVRLDDPSAGHFQGLLLTTNCPTGDGVAWALQEDGDHYFYPWSGNQAAFDLVSAPFTNGVWQHAAVTYAFATRSVRMYLDGNLLTPSDTNVDTLWQELAQPTDWHIGGSPAFANSHLAGDIDELRIAAVHRSADWILTEYRNQSAPTTFSTLGELRN